MRRRSVLLYAAVPAIVVSGVVAGGAATAWGTASTGHSAVASAAAAGWGTARAVQAPDHRSVGLDLLSCSGPGDCSAVGWYTDTHNDYQGFVIDEKNGSWDSGEPAPGLATLNRGDDAGVGTVSCSSPGDCGAGGSYFAGPGYTQRPFVIDEKGGTWGAAVPVPGIEAINVNGNAEIDSLSCGSAGNCSAIGDYRDAGSRDEVFAVNETGGVWGTAAELPGMATLSAGPANGARPTGLVSCTAPGDCTAAGNYFDPQDDQRTYAATETGGVWRAATTVPGTTSTPTTLTALSCASAGNCAAGGGWWPTPGSAEEQALVLTEAHGAWGAARTVPGIAGLEKAGGSSRVASVACGSAGNCAAVGTYWTDLDASYAFVVTETDGTWGSAKPLSSPAPHSGPLAGGAYTVSCPSAGNCSAGGDYRPSPPAVTAAFVVTETNGTWGAARAVPGLPDYSGAGDVWVDAISCATPSYCGAVGPDDFTANGAFVVTKAPLQATRAALKLSAAKVTYGHEQTERLTVTVTPQHSGTPAGTVTVKAGKTTVCEITLKAGQGGCTLAPKKLPAGAYHLVAAYGGSLYYLGSASAGQALTVLR
jgi:hypothetical protein